jgi:hypothetical protein
VRCREGGSVWRGSRNGSPRADRGPRTLRRSAGASLSNPARLRVLLRAATPHTRQADASSRSKRNACKRGVLEAGATGLEPATSGVTGRRSNQLSYAPGGGFTVSQAKSGQGGLGASGRRASTLVDGRRNFRPAGEFQTQNRSPEDAPNPAVGAFVGISDGDPAGSPSCFKGAPALVAGPLGVVPEDVVPV